MSQRDVPLAIVGISCVFPEADGLQEFWRNIRNGKDSITEIPEGTHWSPDDYYDSDPKSPDMTYARRGGFLPPVDFNPLEFGIAPNTLEATDTAQLLGLVAAQRALIDAGYGPEREFDRDKVSVLLGVTGTLELSIPLGARLGHPRWRRALKAAGVDEKTADEVVQRISDSYVEWQEAAFPGLLGNVVAGRIANRLDLGGTNCVVDAACASALSAIHLAAMELATGRCDLAVTGGVDTFNDIFMYMCFSKTPALSPTGNARPFDHQGDGTILGEGVGIVVLKRLDDAVRDGDRIYAEIRGLGTSSDGKGNAIYAPSSSGQAKALRRAYEAAGIGPETVELVEAHGTGTVVGDAVEATALNEVYRDARAEGTWCALGSVKSQIGHTKAAAGVAALIKTAMALHKRVLPPTIKVERPLAQVAPEASPFYVNTEKRPWLEPEGHPRRAALSSFGFGGSNFHCVLQEHDAPSIPDWDGEVQILAFSAATPHALEQKLASIAADASWAQVRALAQTSRAEFRSSDPERLLLVIERTGPSAHEIAQRAANLITSHTEPAWSTPESYYGRGEAAGTVAFLFPGQGSQYVGMLRDLACHFPEVRETLDRELAERIYPHPAFDDETRAKQGSALRDTRTAQPAIGAVSLGALKVLRRFGVEAAAVGGHSFGELTALCAAGRLGEQEFAALARRRGQLMGKRSGDCGSMLAVRAAGVEVEKVVAAESLDLVVANRNAPEQVVLSGPTGEIERAADLFRARQMDARVLPVSAAFHSRLVADAETPFADTLAGIEFHAGRLPVYANTTAVPYPEDPDAARALLAGQLARPVEFVEQIENLHAAGVRTFVEVGPGATLTALTGAILEHEGRPHETVALDASRGKRSGIRDLARALAKIAAHGHAIDLKPWDASFVPATQSKKKPALTVPVSGANLKPLKNLSSPKNLKSPETTPKRETMQTDEKTRAQPSPATPVPAPASLHEALRVTQENMLALQRLQEQTARLHQQFLEGQTAAQQSFHSLMIQQQRLLDLSVGLAPTGAPAPAAPMLAPPMAVTEFVEPAAPVVAPLPAPIPAPAPQPVAAPAPTPINPPAPTPPPVDSASTDAESILLAVVAEKTGYPTDILELGMELDADLGIDSIKRVEILSALQDRLPDAPKVKPDQLATLRTLGQVLEFLTQGRPVARPKEPQPATQPAQDTVTPTANGLQRFVLRACDLDGGAETPGPDASAPVWISDADPELARRIAKLLKARGLKADVVGSDHDGASAGALVLLPPRPASTDEHLLDALRLLKFAGSRLSKNALCYGITRLDGSFGTSGDAIADPLSGGIAGLVKCAAHEWPEVGCRVLDLAPALGEEAAARAIVKEMFCAGPIEVGLTASGRRGLELAPVPLREEEAALPLHPGDVVVLSGGARGVTAEAAVALARACRPTLVLLGRSAEPRPEPAWLAPLTGEAEIKRAILAQKAATTPREVGRVHARIRAEREIRGNLDRMRATGCTVRYLAVNVRDSDAVQSALDAVREEHGPIRALVHGAGILRDQQILEKTEESFRLVYDTKVAGLRNLLAAVKAKELRALVIFSSSTARYGRAGQVDYAVANEVLNKIAQKAAQRLTGCKVVSLNWGPWDGGMVDDSLRALFAREGIPLIPLERGAVHMLKELAVKESAIERLVLGPVGAEEPPAKIETGLPRVFEREIDVTNCPFLRSHVLDGKAVVPMAVLIEWLAHGAMHGNPGLAFCGMDNLRVLKGVVLDARAKETLHIHAGNAQRMDQGYGQRYRIPVELRGADDQGGERLHARAEVLLRDTPDSDDPRLEPPVGGTGPEDVAAVYRDHLFQGEALQGMRTLQICDDEGLLATARSAPAPRDWMSRPFRRRWLADPLALDVGFQLMTLWCSKQRGAPSLPCHLERYRQFGAFPEAGTRIVVRITRTDEHRAFADMEFLGGSGALIARIEGYECVIDPALIAAFSNRLLEARP